MMVPLVCRSRLWWSLAAGTRRVACRHWGSWAAEARNKPLKQWTLIVHPLSSLRVKLPCNVRVRPQDPLTYPDADRVFVVVSGVDRNVHRGLDLDNIEVRYDEESRQVLISSQDIDSQTCVEVTTPLRFGMLWPVGDPWLIGVTHCGGHMHITHLGSDVPLLWP